jgi:hypothetical protein
MSTFDLSPEDMRTEQIADELNEIAPYCGVYNGNIERGFLLCAEIARRLHLYATCAKDIEP